MARKQGDMHQTALRLPRELHRKLGKIGGERGMGEEIRRRLEASFEREADAAHDPKLTELQALITDMAGLIQLDSDGPWHSDPFAFEAFRAAILHLLDVAKPEGEVKAPTGAGRALGLNDPVALGRAYAHMELRRAGQPTGGGNG
ncbi:MAG: hypothetical protein HYX68_12910 [Planctomycetes bacterium]|jgi:hypothetical protein|nr:hypothetical protein [Planctomycetota bacterium]